MELILCRNMRWFLVAMALLQLQLLVRHIVPDNHVLVMVLFAALNMVFYAGALLCCHKKKYVQLKQMMIVLCYTTLGIYVFKTLYEMNHYGERYYIFINSTILHFCVEWILITRIQTVNRLLYLIAEKERTEQWIKC